MGLRSINNPKSSFEDPYASTGLEAYLPSNAYITGAWYGTYGIWAGGYRGAGGGDGTTNLIQYVTIANTGNAASGGSLTQARQYLVGCSNGTRGLFMGGVAGNGVTDFNIIEYLPCATPGSSTTDFGDLTLKRAGVGAGCDGMRALCVGGYDAGNWQNIIDYVTVATTGNATDFGDTTQDVGYGAACNDNMRLVYGGGQNTGGNTNVMEYVAFQTLGNATDFGDLNSGSTQALAACSSLVRGIFAGGTTGSYINEIQRFDIQTTGNASDFGDLTVARFALAGCSNAVRGVFGGGKISNGNSTNTMDYITIDNTSNATDFGDLQNGAGNTSNGTGRQGIAALGGG